jgi:hypothetical protein
MGLFNLLLLSPFEASANGRTLPNTIIRLQSSHLFMPEADEKSGYIPPLLYNTR